MSKPDRFEQMVECARLRRELDLFSQAGTVALLRRLYAQIRREIRACNEDILTPGEVRMVLARLDRWRKS